MAENNRFDITNSINGDAVIGFSSQKEFKNVSWADASTVSTWLQDGDDSTSKHLGLIDLWGATHNVRLPFMSDLFKKAQVLEVEEGQRITYDLPVKRSNRCVTASDTSNEKEFPGIDGGVFQIVLDRGFSKGDVLTYDPMYGEQVVVDDQFDILREGENFRHFVRLVENDKRKWFPKDKLKAGLEYHKIGHGMGEFGTDYSQINLGNAASGTITNEFILGDPRGVETFYTRKANNMKATGLTSITDSHMEECEKHMDMLGKGKDMFFMAKMKGGQVDKSSVKVGATLEYFVLMELAKLEAYQLFFQKAALLPTANGNIRLNEGVWHQIRRGKLIQYARPGGITKQHIQEAVSYMFKSRGDLPTHKRQVKFKCGWFAYQNMLEIFREEIQQQIANLAPFMGTDKFLPKSPLSGQLDNLSMEAVMFTDVYLSGIGKVKIEHEPSLDYQPFTDRFSTGFFGDGMARTAHSMVIWDASDSEYSNADVSSKVKGAKVIKGGQNKANIYYVKPEGSHVTYGYEQGRMAGIDNSVSYVQSSLKQMGRTFWAHSQSGALVLDTTRYIVIELRP